MVALRFNLPCAMSADHHTIIKRLKIADQIIVQAPIADSTSNNANDAVTNSGADVPIAINVAQATESSSFRFFPIRSKLFMKCTSHTLAKA
jgi:hypothetical protein